MMVIVKKIKHLIQTFKELPCEVKFTLLISMIGNIGGCAFLVLCRKAQKEGNLKLTGRYGRSAGFLMGMALTVQALFDAEILKITKKCPPQEPHQECK